VALSAEVTRFQAWVLAARPKTLAAAIAPVLVGTGFAAHDGALAILPAVAALLGAVLIQIGTNLANDYYDFIRGADTEDRVGPIRVTQAGLLSPESVRNAMVGVLASAVVIGVYLVAVGGWPIVWVGVASIACAVLYTGGPFPLAYHGLGDVFVFLFFGLVAVGGTYFVQTLSWSPGVLLAGAGVGSLNTAILVVNNLRDVETDAKVGKRTLAVRLGATLTKAEFGLLILVALMAPVVGVLFFDWPIGSLLALIAALFCRGPLHKVATYRNPHELIPVLGATAKVVAIYGLSLALGLGLG